MNEELAGVLKDLRATMPDFDDPELKAALENRLQSFELELAIYDVHLSREHAKVVLATMATIRAFNGSGVPLDAACMLMAHAAARRL